MYRFYFYVSVKPIGYSSINLRDLRECRIDEFWSSSVPYTQAFHLSRESINKPNVAHRVF